MDALAAEARIAVRSVWDLVSTPESYPEAIPVLARMLGSVHDPEVKEGIARALTVKGAGPLASRPLIDAMESLFDDTTAAGSSARWAIGNALSVIAPKEAAPELLMLLRRRETAEGRQMLALGLARLKYKPAIPVLLELLGDEQLVAQVTSALATLGAIEAIPRLEPLLEHPNAFVRKTAKKALEKLRR